MAQYLQYGLLVRLDKFGSIGDHVSEQSGTLLLVATDSTVLQLSKNLAWKINIQSLLHGKHKILLKLLHYELLFLRNKRMGTKGICILTNNTGCNKIHPSTMTSLNVLFTL